MSILIVTQDTFDSAINTVNNKVDNSLRWQFVSQALTLTANRKYLVNPVSAFPLALPPSPNVGDTVQIRTMNGINAITIDRNGELINEKSNNGVMRPRQDRTFIYTGPTAGWFVDANVINFVYGKPLSTGNWDIAPSSLENAVDGDMATFTGLGIVDNKDQEAWIELDLGIEYSGYVLASILYSSTQSERPLRIDSYDEQRNESNVYMQYIPGSTGVILAGGSFTGRYIRFKFPCFSGLRIESAIQEIEVT